ncbi:uncharacterized protein FIBRA_07756 [Fibroporia radiculosa]|uniref:Thioesterase domain-containing protein n=1 Tax=Fibroporia radiculosa TaxID=599839 RepID=J4GVJ8_9APHY|nr:uncharacterized protein FIBRA_07756 [Fibroporia radiculosa]CCM05530.1 predicted protein [Fibroporia radiculosa]
MSNFLSRVQTLPDAPPPNDNPASIKGNVPLEHRRHLANLMAYHIANHPGSRVFAHSELGGLKQTELYVRWIDASGKAELLPEDLPQDRLRKLPLQGQTVCEITVTEETREDMLNVHGVLAGAFGMTMVDVGTFSALFIVSLMTGIDATGTSATFNLVWHSAARMGMELRMVSTTLSVGGSMMAARAEVYEKKTSRLLLSAIQTISPFNKKSKTSSSGAKL